MSSSLNGFNMLKRFPKPTHLKDFKWRGLFLFILIMLVIVSLVAIVSVQHNIRTLEAQYYHSLKQSLNAAEESGRLRLEKEHLTAPARVDQIARNQLNMTSDKSNFEIIYLIEEPVIDQSVALDKSELVDE